MKNTLTLMCGLPRSGKSTWIEKNKGNAIVVSHDWIRENILGTHYAPTANSVIWTLADTVLRVVLGQNKDVILDGLNNNKFIRGLFIDVAREYKSSIRLVCINTPVGICLKRNSKSENHKLPQEKLLQINEEFEWPCLGRSEKLDEIVWVDDCWSKEELNELEK